MAPAPRPLSIGAVVHALADEFPELTISKVRFLETEGLLSPARTGSGYRQYAKADVDRLRWVLRMQRDRFWPLTAIREALEAADRGLDPAAAGRAAVPDPALDPDLPDDDGLLARGPLRISAGELAEATGLSAAEVTALGEHGLLRPHPDGSYRADDLRAATAAAGLARYGLEARHLRVVRAAADRESGLLEQATASLRGAGAAEARSEALRLVLALHAALVRGGLDAPS
ncbi:MerR family transcriptional regulator [uncultured Phycicoccus sp.]|uniref:transcriptional regulator FtsR n=1 Tax=uncultured Phycicoccus sp. TaxID=661422 RepID=UPI00262A2510|nr:MerR family transcriptional regulator [uncultured Phycicoccus sp.]